MDETLPFPLAKPPSALLPKLAALDVGRPEVKPVRRSFAHGPKAAVAAPRPAKVVPLALPVDGSSVARIRTLADCGQWDAAAAACDDLLAATPLDAWAHFYRAMIHEQVGEAEHCEKALRRAIYLDRRLVLPHYHLGLFLLRRDEGKGASRAFRNVLALLQDSSDDALVADGEKITAGQMREAVGMHLTLIGGAA